MSIIEIPNGCAVVFVNVESRAKSMKKYYEKNIDKIRKYNCDLQASKYSTNQEYRDAKKKYAIEYYHNNKKIKKVKPLVDFEEKEEKK